MEAESAVRFVIENLLRPIGIDLSPNVFNQAATGEEEVLNDMKQAVYLFLANLIISNKQDQRNWIRNCTPDIAGDVLRLLGFDPFLFDLDNSSQHLLVTLCWLIWRADLFKTLYDNLLPSDDTYLPPYGTLCVDENEVKPKPLRPPPKDHEELTRRIQRLVGKISYQLQTLSDLEMTRETLHWQIRAIDPDSSLYALSLKSKPAILAEHTKALRQAVENAGKLKNLEQTERIFWRWAFSIVDNLNLSTDRFEETRSIPIDWFPPLTCAPYTRHNQGVDEISTAFEEMKEKMALCKEKIGTGKINEKQSGLNGRQIDLIKREIDDYMESLERIEEIKIEEKEEEKTKLIPELSFREFSDSKLQRIIVKSENKCAEIAQRCCPEIEQIVASICEEYGYHPHGWKCDVKITHIEEEDTFERQRPSRAPSTKQKSIAQVARQQAAAAAKKAAAKAAAEAAAASDADSPPQQRRKIDQQKQAATKPAQKPTSARPAQKVAAEKPTPKPAAAKPAPKSTAKVAQKPAAQSRLPGPKRKK